MIALTQVRPGAIVILGPLDTYTVQLNSGNVLVLRKDGEDVQITHSEVRRIGMQVRHHDGRFEGAA